MAALIAAASLYLMLVSSVSTAVPVTIHADETTPFANEEYRLNNKVVPENYDLELNLPPGFGDSGTFSGSVRISIKPTISNSDPITLHVNPDALEIVENGFDMYEEGSPGVSLIAKPYTQNKTLHMVTFNLATNTILTPARKYILEIQFEGKLLQDMNGFYRSSYKDEAGNIEWIATTQFQPTHARRAFPCFDEPQYKATFDIRITYPQGYHAISNTAIQLVEDIVAGTGTSKRTTFETTPKMSTYLIAFIVSKYVRISHPVDLIDNSVLSPVETVDSTKYGLMMAPKLLDVMKDFTLIPYSTSKLGKLDQVSIPDFSAGAMENWGIVTYRETALHWDPNESSARNKQRVGTVVAHELAHMWFGNLVTLKWWSATWLNEGFARYFEYHATAEVETDWQLDKQFVVEQHQVIMNSDSSSNSPVLTSDVYTPSEISAKFGSISYSKGGSVIRMMAHFLGHDVFKRGIQQYLYSYSFDNTEPNQLFDTIGAEANNLPGSTDLGTLMDSWTTKPGFPLVTVSIDENNRIVLTQEQFLFNDAESSDTTWYIPITYTTGQEKDFSNTLPEEWFSGKNHVTQLLWNDASTWIIFNIKASAYIRVKYAEPLLNGIVDALKKDLTQIDALNRAQIVDDIMSLARAGKETYQTALNILLYLESETEYYPWYPAFNAFAYLRRRIDSTSNLAQLLSTYISQIMEKFYEDATVLEEETQIEIHKQVLALTWACELNHADCIQSAKNQFNELKTNDIPVNPNLRSIVYCNALRQSSDRADWNFLWNRFTETRVASEAAVLLTALGCSKDPVILKEYLQMSIEVQDKKVRSQDAQSVFTAVLNGNPEGVDIAFEFLKESLTDIEAGYGGMNALTTVITGIADRLTTKEQVDEFEQFVIEREADLKDAAVRAREAIETARNNLQWVEKFKDDLENYLQETVGDNGGDGGDGGNDGGPDGATSIAISYFALAFSTIIIFLTVNK